VKRYATDKQTAFCKSGAFHMEKPTFTDYVTLIFNLFGQFIQASGPDLDWFSARYHYEHKTLIGDITKSCGLAKKKRWRIPSTSSGQALVGVETYKAVRSRKEDTPCATIPHSLKPFEMKFT
jgi:hypothetical protein